jgi:two-component system LytT family sensor kinase
MLLLAHVEPGTRYGDNEALYPVSLVGDCTVDGEVQTPLTEAKENRLPEGRQLVAQGTFSRDIPENGTLMFYCEDTGLDLQVNGKRVLSSRQQGGVSYVSASPGYRWICFTSPGITQTDRITLTITNVHNQDGGQAFSKLFNQMYTGSVRELTYHLIRHNLLSFLAGISIFSFGMAILIASLMGLFFRVEHIVTVLFFAGLCIVSGGWIFLGGSYISLLIPYAVWIRTALCICRLAIPVLAALYVRGYVTGRARNMLNVTLAMNAVLLLSAIICQAAGKLELEEFLPVENLLIPITIAAVIAGLSFESRRRKNKSAYYALLSLLPVCAGGLADLVNVAFRLGTAEIGFCLGFLFFVCMQIAVMMYTIQEKARRSLKLENELLQNRVTMMLSQIQPHFLYNSLTAIKQLCVSDPKRAEECVGSFAAYLRTNLDSLSKSALIPLTKELAHTEQYLKLEQMRFGERVKVCFDLQYTGFSLPSLTVQPLVENAVRYGITKRPKGGTVTIFAQETEEAYVVRVSDDGVGFDKDATLSTDRSHIGIDNVKSRLAALCGGSLTVESVPGEGTTATISIPKREASEL